MWFHQPLQLCTSPWPACSFSQLIIISWCCFYKRRQTTKCPLRVIDCDCQLEDSIDFPRFPLILHGHSNTRVTAAATRGLHFRAGDQMPNHWKVWPRLGNLLEESMAYWWPFEVACDKRELVLILRPESIFHCTVLKEAYAYFLLLGMLWLIIYGREILRPYSFSHKRPDHAWNILEYLGMESKNHPEHPKP